MKKPEISKKFTIEDIHKIREYNSFITKKLSSAERMDYYAKKAEAFLKEGGLHPQHTK